MTALIELVKALRVNYIQNYRAGVRLEGDLSEILKDLDDPSKLRPQLTIVRGYGAYSVLEVAFLICANFVCCSLTAPSSLGVMVLRRKRGRSTTDCARSNSNTSHSPSPSLTFHPSLRNISIYC